jgi:hypothetical protein
MLTDALYFSGLISNLRYSGRDSGLICVELTPFECLCRFSLIKEHLVEFNQLAMANAEGSDDMLNRVMTKDNIGLAALLQTKEGAFEAGIPPLREPSVQYMH